MRLRKTVLSLALLLALPWNAYAQDNMANVKIESIHVAGKVHMLTGRGGNIGVSAGPDGLLMVDDQYAPLSKKIKAALRKLDKGDVQFVLNTHWHLDHTGGNPEFGRDAHIVAHTNVRKRLATAQKLFGRTIEPLPEHGLPVVTFEDGITFHFNGEQVRVLHFPHGHTDGDSIVFFTGSNVIHMGDHYFNGMYPFVDLDHGGDVEGMRDNVKAVLALASPGAKIIPGHGPLATIEDMQAYAAMLDDSMWCPGRLPRGEPSTRSRRRACPASGPRGATASSRPTAGSKPSIPA